MVSITGNFIVLFVAHKSKQLRNSQYVYSCSISGRSFYVYPFMEVLVAAAYFCKIVQNCAKLFNL